MALYPPPEVVHDIVGQVARLRVGEAYASGVNTRLARPDNLHVTLCFLGEVEDGSLPVVTDALSRAARTWRRLAGVVGSREGLGPPRLRLAGGGRFGRGQFTVLWTGLAGDVDALHLLGRAVRRELKRARLPHDRRPFRPHLTIARPGDRLDRAAVDEDVATLDGYLGPSWPVTEMVLVRSNPGPRPAYEPLATWQL